MKSLALTLDEKNKNTLSIYILSNNINVFKTHLKGNKVILEPLTQISNDEEWLFTNKIAFEKIKKDLSQKGSIRRGSFKKYTESVDE